MIVEKRVVSGADDVEQNSSGALYVNSTDLELVTDGTNVQTVGLRFSSVNIPQGAVVTQAYVQFKTDEVSTGPAALSIRGEDADDAAGFSGAYSVSSRPQTSASTTWTPPEWTVTGAAGAAQRTPDLASVVQEIVARPGWQALNDMTFTITGSGRRTAESFEGDASGAPLLHIEYTVPDERAGLRFAALGDWSDGLGTQAVADLIGRSDVDFIITTGDNIYDPEESIDSQVGRIYGNYIGNYSGAYGPGSASNRFFPSLGNHDYSEHGLNAYLNYFTLPGNERYYDFKAGPVHFFAINSNPQEPAGTSSSSSQATWLRDGLANSDAPHKIVYFHHPPYSSSTVHGSELGMRWPFEEWGATAVFSGHDHAYERVMRDDNGDGVLLPYFTTGLGGHSRYSFGTPVGGSAVRYSADFGTMIIDASDTQIDFEFWSVAGGGRLIDNYRIASTVDGGDPDVVYRWAAGPTTVAATDGGPAWTADASVVKGGPTALFAGGITALHASAAGTPVGLFANERYDVETGAEMGLDFGTGLAAGAYTVRLFMGNAYDGTKTVGSRVFDVLIENGLAFDNVDLVARFGHKTGGILEWTGQVTDGRVDIDFVHMVQNPLINGVEILRAGPALPTVTLAASPTAGSEAAGTTITLTATASAAVSGAQTVALSLGGTGLTAGDFVGTVPASLTIADGATSASVTLQVADDALAEGLETAVFTIANPSSGIALGATKTASVAITDNDVGPTPQVVYRWAAGATTVAATDGGPAWTADASVVKGGPSSLFATGITLLHASAAGAPVGLFANERYDDATGAEMGLDFGTGLAAGEYIVRLFMGNGYEGTKTVGSRVFDVRIEDTLAFNDVDLVARFGHKRGGMLEWHGQVTDGRVDIDFAHVVQNPLINGVEILAVPDLLV